jgi:hypothetical protein
MLKEQRQEIKKLKKRHELSKCTTTNLQHRIDSICNSLDELSCRTLDSDLSSADLSSALSMVSSKARSDDSSSDSLDSKYGPDQDFLPSRPSPILFSKAQFCTFGANDPPLEIRAHRQHDDDTSLTSRLDPPSNSRSSAGWISPKKKKSHTSSLKLAATSPWPLVTANSFSPLAADFSPPASTTSLSSLGRTRSPSKSPASKKLRISPVPISANPCPPHDVDMTDSTPHPQHLLLANLPDQDMTWEHDAFITPADDALSMNESVNESL